MILEQTFWAASALVRLLSKQNLKNSFRIKNNMHANFKKGFF